MKTGLFGTNESFVPLDQAELTDDGIRVPYDKDRVKGAPNIETDRELSEQEEDQLYSYYGLAALGSRHGHDDRHHDRAPTATPTSARRRATGTTGTDAPARDHDPAPTRTTIGDTDGRDRRRRRTATVGPRHLAARRRTTR